MEKANNVYVYPSSFGWTDLGTWSSLYKKLSLDKNKNTITGKNVITYECNKNIIKMPNEKLVVLQGLEGYIIVEKDDVLLVCKKEEEQKIKQFVSDLSKFKNSN
jgi:mannose-1-phosphate guanylyltransferase